MRAIRKISLVFLLGCSTVLAQEVKENQPVDSSSNTRKSPKVLYGVASFYADKFEGRQTANGQYFSQNKMTAACNKLPLNTWIRVTNLKNKRSVVLFVNDRLHPKNPRLVDCSRMAAKQLGYIGHGLAQVKVEVLVKQVAK